MNSDQYSKKHAFSDGIIVAMILLIIIGFIGIGAWGMELPPIVWTVSGIG